MKADKKGRRRTKRAIVALSLMLILAVAAGGTLAWLETSTQKMDNTFTPGRVSSEVEETLDGAVKKDVRVKNTGNAAAYIRAAVVINLADENDNIYAADLTQDSYCTVVYGDSWQLLSDGYYYYKGVVESSGVTANLIDSCSGNTVPVGYHLKVQILADAIQAEGTDEDGNAAVKDAWGVSFNGNTWS